MATTTKKQSTAAKVGDAVLFDGDMHLVVDQFKRYSRELDALVGLLVFENTNRKVTILQSDLRWDAADGNWYMWGRSLAKGDRVIVSELRDRGLLPARRTRSPGNGPAGGEHCNLYKALFKNRPAGFWETALAEVRAGGDLPEEAVAAIGDFGVLFRQKLTEGYADPDVDDSQAEG